MDIARPVSVRRRRIRRTLYGAATLAVLLLITLGVARLKPAAPTVERATDARLSGTFLQLVRICAGHGRDKGLPWTGQPS